MTRIEMEAHKFGASMAKDKNKEAFEVEKLGVNVDIAGHKMGIDAARGRDQIDTQKGQIAAQLIAAQMNAKANQKAREAQKPTKEIEE
jgi:hypothetical protein